MVLGRQTSESTQYGRQDFTVAPIEGADLAEQLSGAIRNIRGTYAEAELPDLGEDETIVETIPADPNVRNFSYTVVDGELYYRQNSIMTKPDFNATAKERAKGMVELRDCVQKLISEQMDGFISDETIRQTQAELNTLYDGFTAKYGLINSRANALAFAEDSSYYLLCSLEELDEDKNLKRKADMFTRRTIRAHEAVTSVDTASEALALSISEKACVDMEYMSKLCHKSLFVVPNHLTEQWSGEFLRLYPSANILVATKKDFEPKNRKKFCARIATGEYDAVIIGHSQFEKIPVSMERQQRLLAEQIFEVEEGLRELKSQRAERFTIKSLERTKRGLEAKLKKLQDSSRKDDVVTFEQLGVDRLYVDEAHNYVNLFYRIYNGRRKHEILPMKF